VGASNSRTRAACQGAAVHLPLRRTQIAHTLMAARATAPGMTTSSGGTSELLGPVDLQLVDVALVPVGHYPQPAPADDVGYIVDLQEFHGQVPAR
jgi:hypothetical protein